MIGFGSTVSTIKVRLRLALALVLLSVSWGSMDAAAGEFDYLHEHPGKTSATVTGANHALSKVESAAFKRNLERLRSLLAKQPTLASPRGVEIKGYFRPNDDQPKTKKVPIPGFGFLRFHSYMRDKKTGKSAPFCCPTDEMFVAVNDPEKGPQLCTVPGSPTKVFCAPERVEELAGFPVYRFNGMDVIILQRSKVPVWIPLTREEYVKAWLANWQKQAADSPAIDTITPQIVRNHQAALEAMTPEERRMQAREFAWDPFQPTLAPVGSNEGRPLLKINPAWFDPKLPRSAFQLATIMFSYSGTVKDDAPGPTEFGDIAPYRVWQALHESDWGEISGALTDK
ncbi:hypothetical protein OR1_00345 [Geobacter sp. OR-1]|uniref:hypothetical protein n=1 Tax=Geobacter sp. OR-1 TaxID=1266765 RepID=UPI000543C0CF|nr:hypothetical protein [Geobacter sp. OR-1]GAM08075.1 hypothetical protein OR1_00345 [Geobacter sp. OR-1]